MKRYFLISYVYSDGAGDCVVSTDGTMFSRQQLNEVLSNDPNVKKPIVISSVYEFKSEMEFEQYDSKEKN